MIAESGEQKVKSCFTFKSSGLMFERYSHMFGMHLAYWETTL